MTDGRIEFCQLILLTVSDPELMLPLCWSVLSLDLNPASSMSINNKVTNLQTVTPKKCFNFSESIITFNVQQIEFIHSESITLKRALARSQSNYGLTNRTNMTTPTGPGPIQPVWGHGRNLFARFPPWISRTRALRFRPPLDRTFERRAGGKFKFTSQSAGSLVYQGGLNSQEIARFFRTCRGVLRGVTFSTSSILWSCLAGEVTERWTWKSELIFRNLHGEKCLV